MTEPRRLARRHLPLGAQVSLLHGDMDTLSKDLQELQRDMNARIGRLTWALVTAAISFAGAILVSSVALVTQAL